MVAKGEGEGGREELGVGGQRMPTLTCRVGEQQGPTAPIGHSVQYRVTNHNGKEHENERLSRKQTNKTTPKSFSLKWGEQMMGK